MTIINDDSFEYIKKMQSESVDMICTDPPYGMSFVSSYRKSSHRKIENDDNLDWLDDFMHECFRVAKINTAHYFFCSHHHIDKFVSSVRNHFTYKSVLVWEKNNTGMGDLKGDFAPKTEFIIHAQKGRAEIRGPRDSNVLKFDKTLNSVHPTQKPTDLIAYLIKKFSDENDLVFDPFSGSGTTAVACRDINRRFLCCEIDKKYYEESIARLKAPSSFVNMKPAARCDKTLDMWG